METNNAAKRLGKNETLLNWADIDAKEQAEAESQFDRDERRQSEIERSNAL